MIVRLEDNLLSCLKEARSVSVAVALMSDFGLEALLRTPPTCVTKFIVGVDLPTPPTVLRKLLCLVSANPSIFSAKLYDLPENYHPKVYLIEKKDCSYIAFVGSANATKGGFKNNIELSVAVTNQTECKKIAVWFKNLYTSAAFFDENFIANYELTYRRNKQLAATQKSNINRLLRRSMEADEHVQVSDGQFFTQSDFDAFSPENHMEKTELVRQQRIQVQNRFLELHHEIYPRFLEFGMTDLHCHRRYGNLTSLPNHNGRTLNSPKEALWLHYGKSDEELQNYPEDQQTLSSHLRIQTILVHRHGEASIGNWLYIGKSHSSLQDRQALSSRLEEEEFLSELFERLVALGGSSWIWFVYKEKINDYQYVSEIPTAQALKTFLQRDRLKYNFATELIIGRNYNPNDEDLSKEKIGETILQDFSKLYKLFQLIKH